MSIVHQNDWDIFLRQYPETNILQTSAWGMLKSHFGWEPVRITNKDAGAQVLFRKIPLGFHIGYLPKGPVGSNWVSLWSEIDSICHQKKTIFLRVEPDAWEETGKDMEPSFPQFTHTPQTIQPKQTILISLEGHEKDWLGRMKQKTRYNIRLAERKGVVIRESTDIKQFHAMAILTGARDGFGIHTLAYYQRMFDLFHNSQSCVLLMAFYEENPLAGILVFRNGKRSWYLHGASTNEERNRMPTYLLQWEAMRWAASHGCTEYDLWGIPEVNEEELEKEFANRSDGLWGVYRFKRGFGGRIVHSVGSWDRIYIPWLYNLYQLRYKTRKLSA